MAGEHQTSGITRLAAAATVIIVAGAAAFFTAQTSVPDDVTAPIGRTSLDADGRSRSAGSTTPAPRRGHRPTPARSGDHGPAPSYHDDFIEDGWAWNGDGSEGSPTSWTNGPRSTGTDRHDAPGLTAAPPVGSRTSAPVRGLDRRASSGTRSTREPAADRDRRDRDPIPETSAPVRNSRRAGGASPRMARSFIPDSVADERWSGNERLSRDCECSVEGYPFPNRRRTRSTESRRLQDQVISTIGEQRVAVLVAYSEYSKRPEKSFRDLYEEILDEDNPRSLASYYRAVSFGRMWLTGNIYGAYDVPGAKYSFDFVKGAIEAADRAGDVDWGKVDRLYVLVPPSNGAMNRFQPMAAFGNSWNPSVDLPDGRKVTAAITMIDERSMGVPIQTESGSYSGGGRHEFGHTLGWGHQGRLECEGFPYAAGDECPVITGGVNLGGISMGRGRTPTGLELEAVGWTDHERVHVVDRPGTYIIPLSPLSSPTGRHVVKIPRDEEGRFYNLEYRRPVGSFEVDLFDQSAFPASQRVNMDGVFFAIEGDVLEGHGLLSSITLDVDPQEGYRDAYETCLRVGGEFVCPVFGTRVNVIDLNDGRALLRVAAPSIPVIETSTDGDLEWWQLADMLVDPELNEEALETLLGELP